MRNSKIFVYTFTFLRDIEMLQKNYFTCLLQLLPMNKFEDELPIPEDLVTIQSCYRVHCLLSDQSAGQSKVFLAEKEDKKFAIKIHEKEKYFREEVGFLQKMNSRYIVKMIDYLPEAQLYRKCGEIQKWPAIILEFVEKGDLCQYWRVAKRFSQATCKTLFKQMLLAIQHMHECGITHRDIKLQNFILDKDFVLKVADFGFSIYSQGPQGDGILREGKGTNIYWAPEIHKRAHRGLDRDIFSAVIILFLVYTSYPPFTNTLPQNDKYRLIKDGNSSDCQKYWETIEKKLKRMQIEVPIDLKRLFERSFRQNPQQRLTLKELLTNSWVNDAPATQQQVKKELSEIYEKLKVKDERVKEVQKIFKSYQQQIKQQNVEHANSVRSSWEQTSTLGIFVKKYCEYEQMDLDVLEFPEKLAFYSDPKFQLSPPYVLAWVYSVFQEGLKDFVPQVYIDAHLIKWIFEVHHKTGAIRISLCYEVDDETELVIIQGKPYRCMGWPEKWGISWHNMEDNEFWATNIISSLQHELAELAQIAYLK